MNKNLSLNFYHIKLTYRSQNSSVIIVTTLLAGCLRNRGSIPGRGKMSNSALVPTQPSMQLVLKIISLVVRRPGREVDHSPPTNANVMN